MTKLQQFQLGRGGTAELSIKNTVRRYTTVILWNIPKICQAVTLNKSVSKRSYRYLSSSLFVLEIELATPHWSRNLVGIPFLPTLNLKNQGKLFTNKLFCTLSFILTVFVELVRCLIIIIIIINNMWQ